MLSGQNYCPLYLLLCEELFEIKWYANGLFKTKDELIDIALSEGREKIYRVLSFGGGTQSAHLLESHF